MKLRPSRHVVRADGGRPGSVRSTSTESAGATTESIRDVLAPLEYADATPDEEAATARELSPDLFEKLLETGGDVVTDGERLPVLNVSHSF